MKLAAFKYSVFDEDTLEIQVDSNTFPTCLGPLHPGRNTVFLVPTRIGPAKSGQRLRAWSSFVRSLDGKAIPIWPERGNKDSAFRVLTRSLRELPLEDRRVPVMWHTQLTSAGALVSLARKLVTERTLVGAGQERIILLGADCSLGKIAGQVDEGQVSFSWLNEYWGVSRPFRRVRKQIWELVRNGKRKDQIVLILGERGTGKEIVARLIARCLYPRESRPSVTIHCASIPSDLFESTVMGHEAGAFTDARTAKPGLIEEAKGRVAFFDELGELAVHHQAKLLRVVEYREAYRLGGSTRIPLEDVRFVFATNANLEQRIAEKTFMPDFHDRIKGFVIQTPSLRKCPEDIIEHARNYWARHFNGGPRPDLQEDALDQLARCEWPGNSRELRRVMENLYASSNDEAPSVSDVRRAMKHSQVKPPPRHRNRSKVGLATGIEAVSPEIRQRAKLVKSYTKLRGRYEKLASIVRSSLDLIAQRLVIFAFVQVHVMNKAELAKWLMLPGHEDVSDLETEARLYPGSVTIVAQTACQVRDLSLAFKRTLGSSLVSLPDATIPLDAAGTLDCALPFVLNIDRNTRNALRTALGVEIPDKLLGLRLRLEIKTILRYTREQMSRRFQHDPSRPLPDLWLSELNEMGRSLHEADEAMARMDEGVRVCDTDRLNPAGQDNLLTEMAREETLLQLDPENPRLAARLGKLALDADDLKKAIQVFTPFEASQYGPLLRDFGVALCKDSQPGTRQFQRGEKLIEKACHTSGVEDADAFCSLGGVLKRANRPKEAFDYYSKALEIDRASPYALGGVIETGLLAGRSIDIDDDLRTHMREVMKRSSMQADAGVNMPWAFFDLGKYSILLGSPLEGLSCVARGVSMSTAPWQIETTLRSFEALLQLSPVPPRLSDAHGLLALAHCRNARDQDLEAALEQLNEVLGVREELMTPLVIVTGGEENQEGWDADRYLALLNDVFANYRGGVAFAELAGPLRDAVGSFLEKVPEGLQATCYDALPGRSIRRRFHGNTRGTKTRSSLLFVLADMVQSAPTRASLTSSPTLFVWNPDRSSRVAAAALGALGVTTFEARDTFVNTELAGSDASRNATDGMVRVTLDATRLRQLLPKEVC